MFDLGLALDRDYPMQAAVGMISPLAVVPTTKGPPHIGPTGWLFHVDSPNLLAHQPAAGGGRLARLHRDVPGNERRARRDGGAALRPRSSRRGAGGWRRPGDDRADGRRRRGSAGVRGRGVVAGEGGLGIGV